MSANVKSEKTVCLDLMMTLIAAAFMAYSYYGIRIVIICIICMASCFITDAVCIHLRGKKLAAEDICSPVTGMIIALMMPASVPYDILIITCIAAIIIGKQAFGGRKNLIFSPAATGFVFAALSWKSIILMYPKPYAQLTLDSEVSNTLFSSLSSVINSTSAVNVSDTDLMLGIFTGPIGATNLIVLIVCALVLIFRKSIAGMTTIGMLITVILCASVFRGDLSVKESVLYALIGNMTVFTAIYIISDIRIAPKSAPAQFTYGIINGAAAYFLLSYIHLENAAVYAAVILSPLAMAMDEYSLKIKSKLYVFYIGKIQPKIIPVRKSIADKLRGMEANSNEKD